MIGGGEIDFSESLSEMCGPDKRDVSRYRRATDRGKRTTLFDLFWGEYTYILLESSSIFAEGLFVHDFDVNFKSQSFSLLRRCQQTTELLAQ